MLMSCRMAINTWEVMRGNTTSYYTIQLLI